MTDYEEQIKIFKKVVREFWFTLACSLVWTTYLILDQHIHSWAIRISVFVSSFFFILWFTERYFRFRTEIAVEERDEDLLNHVTGGESFCYLTLGSIDHEFNRGILTAIHQGRHTLLDVTARVVDLDIFETTEKHNTLEDFTKGDTTLNFNRLLAGYVQGVRSFNLEDKGSRRFNIFWTARNGGFTQLLRLQKVNGH